MSAEHIQTFLIIVGGIVCLFAIVFAWVYVVLAVLEKIECDLKARKRPPLTTPEGK